MFKKLMVLVGSCTLLVGFAAPSFALDIAEPEPATALSDAAVDALVDAWVEFFDLGEDERALIDAALRTMLAQQAATDSDAAPLLDEHTLEVAEQTLRTAAPELLDHLVETTRENRATTAIATALKLDELGIEDDGTPLNELLEDNDVDLDDFLDAVDDLIDRFQAAEPDRDLADGGCVTDCGRPTPTIPATCEDLSTETLDACIDDAIESLPDGALDDLGECDPWNPETWSICVETQLPGGFDALPDDCDLSNLAVAISCIEHLDPGAGAPPAPTTTTTAPPEATTTTELPATTEAP